MTNNINKQPKIVVIGGGTGLPVVLKSLKKHNVDITAIVTVADDGGSSGIIRNYMNVLPPGDIRNVLVSLSNLSQLELDIFQYRFQSEDQFFAGHAIGNLIIAALSEMQQGFFDGVQTLTKLMRVQGHVFPASDSMVELHAQFEDETEAVGETTVTATPKKINKVWVESKNSNEKPKAVDSVIKSILEADQIVLGPGSLFTSILPNLMIENIADALRKTKAQIIYICNIMTQSGETDDFTDADHVRVLNQHLKENFVDIVLVNNQNISKNYINNQNWKHYSKPVIHDEEKLKEQDCDFVLTNFVNLTDKGIYHDGDLVAKELMKLLK
ncbi:uridine diphosphate-N-acetylglucosamine-binding protein YvcK [Lactobacillus sp. S2-2]|uniref:gluconeogenesis factor YvcK family protein n=1 Tax=Lactobacillus sp. S2-2 TaxID=2692917 RepID=UPI001F268CDC|nr:gluconeogenesis factor YvcK family protein [Lactobacillus sp. S2-2]MCF6515696.1 uridine diphosphate-N-acetylglucosamine-binding protein YvcK [Lactobacillus sp. S2-2]